MKINYKTTEQILGKENETTTKTRVTKFGNNNVFNDIMSKYFNTHNLKNCT